MAISESIEASRLELLRMLELFDSSAEPAFDALVQVASATCGCPISLVSLIDVDRQWFKAAVGLDATETPRDQAFCAHAIEGDTLFQVPDATRDTRFVDNPLVTGDLGIRFYAGQPIVYQGIALGTLCVIDRRPRELDASQRETLERLATVLAALLHGRMEAILHRREAQRLHDFAHLSGEWVWESDGHHRCTWLSGDLGIASRLLDGPGVGHAFRDLESADELGSPLPGARLHAHFDRGTAFVDVIVWSSNDEDSRFFALTAEPVIDDDGRVASFRGAARDVTEVLRAKRSHREREVLAYESLVATERRLRSVTDNLPAMISHVDHDRRYTFVNEHHHRIFGETARYMIGRTMREFMTPKSYAAVEPALAAAFTGTTTTFEGSTTVGTKQLHYQGMFVPDIDSHGQVVGCYTMTLDVTERRDAELRSIHSEKRLRELTDALPVLISYIDADWRMGYTNETFRNWLGDGTVDVIGRHVADVIGADRYVQRRDYIARCFAGERVSFELDTMVMGVMRHMQTTYLPDIGPEGEVAGVTALSMDVTDRIVAARHLAQLAHFDSLTQLPNRLQFDNELAEAFAANDADRALLAVMFLDIDRFKAINDTYGHAVGDCVLKDFAARLRHTLRAGDFVARLAGDEFVVILRDIREADEIHQVAARIVRAVDRPFEIGSLAFQVTTSIGVALRSDASGEPAEILAKADQALYRAKEAGRNTFKLAA